MKEIIREFFGFGDLGYTREVEGYLSWQHITFVTVLMIIMTAAAIYFGRKYRTSDEKAKNRVIIAAALLIDGFELFKIIIKVIDSGEIRAILTNLPLFLCSIQLITIPLAAFAKGRLKNASLDFVFIFGLLGAVLGTYFAGNNYGSYPVLSFDNVVSGITHSISGFAALYIGISGMTSMKKRNIPITYAIMTGFGILAYVMNVLVDYNYMFLMRGDGTPYDIFYNLVGGHKVFYPLTVIVLFYAYILAFNLIFNAIRRFLAKKNEAAEAKEEINETVTV